MAKYTEAFKISSVAKLELLKEKGTINLGGVQIKNVRELVAFLDISSYSLYGWVKKINYEGNMDEVDDAKDDIDISDDFFDDNDIEISIETPAIEKGIFGIRYYSWFARNLGVKNYSSMVLAQLKLSIGLKLIEQSGVVDMNKAIAKLKQNGDKL